MTLEAPGNPGAIRGKAKPKHHKLTRAERLHHNLHESLSFHGRMVYTEGPNRDQLFHRLENSYLGAGADCSQFVATQLHWVGIKRVTDTDWTGTLEGKGKPLAKPEPLCVVIYGEPPGVHTGIITGRDGHGDWWVVGFGWQGAPDRTKNKGNLEYFRERGHPGVRYLRFL